MKRWIVAAALSLFAVPPAHADVTVTATISGKGLGVGGTGSKSTTYIKGTKMRAETPDGITILDAAGRQMIVLHANKKEAEIYDIGPLQAQIQKTVGEPKTSMTPTGETRPLLGRTCSEYTMNVTVPMTLGSDTINLTMTGPVWIARGAPGSDDYSTFYKAAAENGLFFGNPQQAKAQGAQLKSMTEMYRTIASLGGIPYQMDAQITFIGSGVMAAMMNKMGGVSTSTTVTSVSTDALSDDLFAVPAGYSTKKKS